MRTWFSIVCVLINILAASLLVLIGTAYQQSPNHAVSMLDFSRIALIIALSLFLCVGFFHSFPRCNDSVFRSLVVGAFFGANAYVLLITGVMLTDFSTICADPMHLWALSLSVKVYGTAAVILGCVLAYAFFYVRRRREEKAV